MAIATVDKAGRIARANAPFASLQHGLIKGDAAPVEGRSILALVVEEGRAALEAAIAERVAGPRRHQAGRRRTGRWRQEAHGRRPHQGRTALGALLRVGGLGERARRRGRDRLRARDDRAARAAGAVRPVAQDGGRRPARRRHRARLQQRALRHHDGDRFPGAGASAERSRRSATSSRSSRARTAPRAWCDT